MPIQRDLVTLLEALAAGYNAALPDPVTHVRGPFQPEFNANGQAVVTYCNLFVNSVASAFGYKSLLGKTANEIHDFISDPANGWLTIGGDVAQHHANGGSFVIASIKNQSGHGHVCVVCPGKMEISGSFGNKPVPKCVNVGKDVFFGKKVSFAFRLEPAYFVLGETV